MTKNDIIKLAREAQGTPYVNRNYNLTSFVFNEATLERFANLVAAAEREACAKLVDHILKDGGGTYGDAIRERGPT